VVRKVDVVDEDTGEVIEERSEREVVLPAHHELVEADFDTLKEAGIEQIFLMRELTGDDELDKNCLLNTIKKDPTNSEQEALEYLYEQLRGTEAPDLETARGVL